MTLKQLFDVIGGFQDLSNYKSEAITPEKAEIIKNLVDRYKKYTVEFGDALIEVSLSGRYGSITHRLCQNDDARADNKVLEYKDGDYDYVSIKGPESILYFGPSEETVEPFNRQGELYVPVSYTKLNCIKRTEKHNIYTCHFEKSNVSFGLQGFKYNSYWHTINFGICLEEKQADRFIMELLSIMGFVKVIEIYENQSL